MKVKMARRRKNRNFYRQELPTNSKKIVVTQLKRLAAMLAIPSEGTSATLRQLIEGKLVELSHEPRNTQVIVASADSKLYLEDESGIIRQESEHVSCENMKNGVLT